MVILSIIFSVVVAPIRPTNTWATMWSYKLQRKLLKPPFPTLLLMTYEQNKGEKSFFLYIPGQQNFKTTLSYFLSSLISIGNIEVDESEKRRYMLEISVKRKDF